MGVSDSGEESEFSIIIWGKTEDINSAYIQNKSPRNFVINMVLICYCSSPRNSERKLYHANVRLQNSFMFIHIFRTWNKGKDCRHVVENMNKAVIMNNYRLLILCKTSELWIHVTNFMTISATGY